MGTCHFALAPIGCFVERFGDTPIINSADIAAHHLSRLSPESRLRLADTTTRAALVYGVTIEISGTWAYGLPQSWATNLQGAGFDGILYRLSHDLEQQLLGVALFGTKGLLVENGSVS